MSNNEINEMFSCLSKGNQVSTEKVAQIYTEIFNEKPEGNIDKCITRMEFEGRLNEIIKNKDIDEELLYLFYHLDKDKKGYLVPEDIMRMFKAVEKNINLNEIQNSFKYAKIYKNKMTFDDFKEYFHNF